MPSPHERSCIGDLRDEEEAKERGERAELAETANRVPLSVAMSEDSTPCYYLYGRLVPARLAITIDIREERLRRFNNNRNEIIG